MSGSSRSVRLRIHDMLTAISQIRHVVSKTSYDAFCKDFTLSNSVIRDFEIMGEACKHLPEKLTDKFPEISWQDIRDMRNILAHEYFGVNLKIVWEAARTELDALESALRKMNGETP